MATVLYVDDQEAIRRAVKLWLSRKGHVVHLAANADAARSVILAERLDGIFIDLWLGEDSGLELYRWIDALESVLGGDSGRLARGRTYARAGRTHCPA